MKAQHSSRPRSTFDGPSISAGTLAWLAVGVAFAALRIGPVLNAPVAGAELEHLSGAWQASIGNADARLIPTLFQSLTALSFLFTTSELPARVTALVATATIPFAIYGMRPVLGNAGALVSLVLLALDPFGILLGGTATAMGFDLAITAWLAMVVLRRADLRWGWVGAGFLVATAGPLPLLFCGAWAAASLTRGVRRPTASTGLLLTGFVLGVVFATARLGAGLDGLVVPPIDLIAASANDAWATAKTADLVALYGLPLLLPGLAALLWRLREWYRTAETPPESRTLMAWLAITGGWLVFSLADNSPLPAAALALPLALLLGPAVARLVGAAGRAEWRLAGLLLAGAAIFGGIALAYALDWARLEKVGNAADQFRVAGFAALMVAILVVIALRRETRAALAVPGLAAGLALLLAVSFASAIPGEEPLTSPYAPEQARALRDAAIAIRERDGGVIQVHPSLKEATTWPFRDSGDLFLASRHDPAAAVVIWPAELPPPAGLQRLEGNWALTRKVQTPTNRVLQGVHWLFDRNTLAVRPQPVAVYTRAKP